jgi:hypothetical protein
MAEIEEGVALRNAEEYIRMKLLPRVESRADRNAG